MGKGGGTLADFIAAHGPVLALLPVRGGGRESAHWGRPTVAKWLARAKLIQAAAGRMSSVSVLRMRHEHYALAGSGPNIGGGTRRFEAAS